MSKATEKFIAIQTGVSAGGEEWQRLRKRAVMIKSHTLDNLDHYLEQFASNVEHSGGRVCWAHDAEEANRYICDLARTRGVRLAVKSKSMMSEEIDLNHALAMAGVEAVETDFGEFIAQLAGERPSHINMPIVHKSRADVADLFAAKLNVGRLEEIKDLASVARRLLRARFAAAEMGITGVNFAIAETGTIVLVENEGNIRFTTALPPVQVAVMGIEKVIPRFADLEVFLRLLPRSGTGQHLTSYQSLLTGPEPEEGEGPRELHLVLLDNGRAELLREAVMRQTLACIRCGACLNACPVYRAIGGHAYGSVYPGPIGAIFAPQVLGAERAAHLPFASSLCGACRDVCPVKIDIPSVLLELRARLVTGARIGGETPARQSGALERLGWRLWSWSCSRPRRFALAARLARLASRLGILERVAPPLRWWGRTRALPRIAPRSFREEWKERRP